MTLYKELSKKQLEQFREYLMRWRYNRYEKPGTKETTESELKRIQLCELHGEINKELKRLMGIF